MRSGKKNWSKLSDPGSYISNATATTIRVLSLYRPGKLTNKGHQADQPVTKCVDLKNDRRLVQTVKISCCAGILIIFVGGIVEVSSIFRDIKTHPIFSSPAQEFIMILWLVAGMLVAWIPSLVLLLVLLRGDDSASDTGIEEESHA